MKCQLLRAVVLSLLWTAALFAQSDDPPFDLWTAETLAAIKDRSTLDLQVSLHAGYADVFFTSNASASWFEAKAPYTKHQNEKIRIHAFLATPVFGGPYPAIVIGHGHGGQADLTSSQLVATQGFVALYIDGPQAGQSTGGPADDNQAWISVDEGPQYGYLYHYAYAGMRALTALEQLASLPGNPYRIDVNRMAVLGASMGGIFTTYINALDSRVKAAVIMASAGNWAHTLRYPNSWLYNGIYTSTRDAPYNGNDPLNSIEDVDTDSTAITFMNYFDPLRYATRQRAPVLTLIGTHDQYFPLPSANLMLQAISSAGTRSNFEKRLWLFPNAPHGFADSILDFLNIAPAILGWLNYGFGAREKPLATPTINMKEESGGLRFDIALPESAARLAGAQATLYAATRIDSTVTPIRDFKSYPAPLSGNLFSALIPAGEKTSSGDTYRSDNVIFYATVIDSGNMPVSSLVYKGGIPMDLSTGFIPGIDKRSGPDVPLPPPARQALITSSGSRPVTTPRGYQGIALTNPTDKPLAVQVEARTTNGRIAAGEGLMNPIGLWLAPMSQKVFLFEQWFGPGALNFDGSFRAAWSSAKAASLSFRGDVRPTEIEGIGPALPSSTALWLALIPEQTRIALRRILITGGSTEADVQIQYRNRFGTDREQVKLRVPAWGTVDVIPPPADLNPNFEAASAEISASAPVSARMEVSGARDPWSVEARPLPAGSRYVQPHTEWNGSFITRLVFVNPSGSQRRVIPRLRTATNGVEVEPTSFFFIQPYGTSSQLVEFLFPTGSARGAGWVELEAPDGPIIVTAVAFDPTGGATAASAVEAPGPGPWSMPYYVENLGYWTGLAIANNGDSAAQVTIQAFDRSGKLLGRADITLEARQSRTQLVYEWIPRLPPGQTGHIVISSTANVQLLAYFGTDDGAAMAAVPFQPIP